MNTRKLSLGLFAIVAFLAGCNTSFQPEIGDYCQNALLPNHVYVMQEFNLQNEVNPDWIISFDHNAYLTDLDQKIKEGQIKTFGNNLYNLRNIGRWKKEPLDSVHSYGMQDLKSIVFLEEWYLDPDDFSFIKKIIAQGPVKLIEGTKYEETNELKELLFWYFPDSLASKPKRIKGDITYMLNFDELNSQSLNKSIFIATVFGAVLTNKLHASDFFTDKKLTNKEIKQKCGFGEEQIAIMDPDDGTIRYETHDNEISNEDFLTALYYDEISDVIFTENWALNKHDLIIHKVVKSISFVREFYRDDEENPGPFKEVLLKVTLNS